MLPLIITMISHMNCQLCIGSKWGLMLGVMGCTVHKTLNGHYQTAWNKASPARFSSNFKDRWTGGKLTVLAWSPEDTLIDGPEIDNMAALLTQQGIDVQVLKDLRGEHDFVWQDGSQIARLIITALHQLRRL